VRPSTPDSLPDQPIAPTASSESNHDVDFASNSWSTGPLVQDPPIKNSSSPLAALASGPRDSSPAAQGTPAKRPSSPLAESEASARDAGSDELHGEASRRPRLLEPPSRLLPRTERDSHAPAIAFRDNDARTASDVSPRRPTTHSDSARDTPPRRPPKRGSAAEKAVSARRSAVRDTVSSDEDVSPLRRPVRTGTVVSTNISSDEDVPTDEPVKTRDGVEEVASARRSAIRVTVSSDEDVSAIRRPIRTGTVVSTPAIRVTVSSDEDVSPIRRPVRTGTVVSNISSDEDVPTDEPVEPRDGVEEVASARRSAISVTVSSDEDVSPIRRPIRTETVVSTDESTDDDVPIDWPARRGDETALLIPRGPPIAMPDTHQLFRSKKFDPMEWLSADVSTDEDVPTDRPTRRGDESPPILIDPPTATPERYRRLRFKSPVSTLCTPFYDQDDLVPPPDKPEKKYRRTKLRAPISRMKRPDNSGPVLLLTTIKSLPTVPSAMSNEAFIRFIDPTQKGGREPGLPLRTKSLPAVPHAPRNDAFLRLWI
jgi:hypothetical protein